MPLQAPHAGQRCHPTVQRQDLNTRACVLFGDEAVEQTGAARSFKGLEDCPPIQWGYQTAPQHVDETGSRVGLGHTIVMLDGDVRLPMTWFEANTSAPLSSIRLLSLLTQCSKSSVGSPVSRRTRTDVSIPKRGVTGLIAEGLDVEWGIRATQLASQRRKTGRVDSPRP